MLSQPGPTRIPLATYRLQFNQQFTFNHAAAILDYLRELGISDVYASPLFRAGPQSTHGYDICGFDQFSPLLGPKEDFHNLTNALRERGLGLLLDMVPNHMGADLSNSWWLDVLEKGRASPYASWFDMDWQPLKSDLHDKVLLPVLEDHYGKVLEAGKLKLVFDRGAFAVAYYERKFPLSADSYRELLRSILKSGLTEIQVSETLKKLAALGPGDSTMADLDELKRELGALAESSPGFRERVDSALAQWNGKPDEPRSFDQLDQILRKQHYRLAYWRLGAEEINYRRFFDVTELVSLRMELPEVFENSHVLVGGLLRDGSITGLRIDHPDGLWDPKQYFERLQALSSSPLYIVAEKILTGDENLPGDWPVAGTTGYDFLNRLNSIFVDPAGAARFDTLYHRFTGCTSDFRSAVYEGKMRILRKSLISEHSALTLRLKAIAVNTRSGQDLSFRTLHDTLAEVIAAFPVYRTYATEFTRELREWERRYVLEAVECAKRCNASLDPAALDFVQRLLLLQVLPELDLSSRARCRAWVMRFQQLTGPVMAKGLEDTAFYNFNRLISLNEVGGDPGTFGADVASFHSYNSTKSAQWPHSLLATATHDTKRGEDLRARLNVLSEMPDEWQKAISRWASLNESKKSKVHGAPAPHPNDEYLLYQTLVGAWVPGAETTQGRDEFRERISAFMLKALREAKARTSWTDPNSAYEEATRNFVERVLSSESTEFLEDFKKIQRRVAFFGTFNSLSQLLLKLTCPGVPDFYQGTELWDFNLVDPDNRRPVDYSSRREMLAELRTRLQSEDGPRELLARLLKQPESGEVKLYLAWRALQCRNAHGELFKRGAYVPLGVVGSKKEHVCSFAREFQKERVVVIVPRLVVRLTSGVEKLPVGSEIWGDTIVSLSHSLPRERYRNMLSGELLECKGGCLQLAGALVCFSVALLKREDWNSSQT